MKFLLSLLFIISSSVFANSVDTQRFTYTGQNNFEEVNLSTDVTRTEYRTERVRSTCYRRTVRRQCRRVCNSNRQCRRVCRNVVVTRPYACWINRRVAVQVFDYENISNITFNFQNNDSNSNINERFTVTQRGSDYKVNVDGSGTYLVRLRKVRENIRRENRVRYVTAEYDVQLTNVALGTKVLGSGLTGVKLSRNVLSFNVGSGFNVDDFTLDLKLYRNRRLGSDVLLFDRDVRSIARLDDNGFITTVTIDLNKLGVNVPSKKRIIIDTDYKVDTTGAINARDLRLNATENWVFR